MKHFSVETKSGVKLGHVCDLVLELNGQLVAQYIVKPSVISIKEYLVSREQIIRFEDKKIIVDDNIEEVENKKEAIERGASPEPVAMRKIEN